MKEMSMGGRGRRGRRLTLAPSTLSSLRPKITSATEDDQDKERRCREGREALSRMVEEFVAVTPRLKQNHATPIKSKFWACDGDGVESEDDEINTPPTTEFVNQAIDAGFSVDQLLRAERALSSGNPSPMAEDLVLSQSIVHKLVSKKDVVRPWRGPLPEPRVSPPRTLGDCLAATLPNVSSLSSISTGSYANARSARQSLPGKYQSVGGNSSSAVKFPQEREEEVLNSKCFETPERCDPQFPPLTGIGVGEKLEAPVYNGNSKSFEKQRVEDTEVCAPSRSLSSLRGKKVVRGSTNRDCNLDRFKTKAGCYFRPTSGLVALFSRTGVKPRRKRNPTIIPQPPLSSLRSRTFAEVVKEGKPMAEQGNGGRGGFGNHGGDLGFNPSFHPGYNSGYGGRGRGQHQSRGRGRGPNNGGRNYGGYGNHYGGNSGYGYGYHGFHGAGRGRYPYSGNFGGGRGRGGGRFNGYPPMNQNPNPTASGGPLHPGMDNHGGTATGQLGAPIPGAAAGQQGAPTAGATQLARTTAGGTLPPQVPGGPSRGHEQGGSHPATGQKPDAHLQASIQGGQAQTDNTTITSEVSKVTVPLPIDNDMSIDPPESSKGTKKSKNKPLCFRCYVKGHTANECTAVLCCDICCGEHVAKMCPFLKKTNISALPYGYAVQGLGFYYIPIVGEKSKSKVEEKTIVVRVLEGSITAEVLAVELERLLPTMKSRWEIQERDKDSFIINLPPSDLVAAVVNWGTMVTQSVPGKIKFEKGGDEEVYKYEIEKVWVQFKGLPSELREFPIIWAVASILGVPKTVDIDFTKKHGRPRMKVAVLDSTLIPPFVDVVVGDEVISLHFGVEEGVFEGEPPLLDLPDEEEPEDDGADPKKDDPKKQEENKEDASAEKPMDIDGKSDEQAPTAGGKQGGATAASTLLQSNQIKKSTKPVVVLSPNHSGEWKAKLAKPVDDSGALSKKSGGTASPGRASKRNTATANHDVLDKATKLKARRNLEIMQPKGTIQGNSLASAVVQSTAA